MRLFINHYFIRFPVPPASYALLAFMAGIIYTYAFYARGFMLCFLPLTSALSAFTVLNFLNYIKKQRITRPHVYLYSIMLFFLAGQARYYYVVATHTHVHTLVAQQSCSYYGWVAALENPRGKRFKQVVKIALTHIQCADRVLKTSYTLTCYLAQKTALSVGDSIGLPALTIKYNLKDMAPYALKEQILATLFLPKLDYTLIRHPNYSITRMLAALRERIYPALLCLSRYYYSC